MLVSKHSTVDWKVPMRRSSGSPTKRSVTGIGTAIISPQQLQMLLTPKHKQNHRYLCYMRINDCSQDIIDTLCWRKQDEGWVVNSQIL